MGLRSELRAYFAPRAAGGDRIARDFLRRLGGGALKKARISSVAHHQAGRRAGTRQDRADKAVMRAAVWSWNLDHTTSRLARVGTCDCGCGGAFLFFDDGECDHWTSRAQGGEHTRENGWRLLGGPVGCHHRRHSGLPPHPTPDGRVRTWNEARQEYCARAEIPFVYWKGGR